MNLIFALPIIEKILDYFKKNKGLNTVTAATLPVVAVMATNSERGYDVLYELFGAEVANLIVSGDKAAIAAAIMIIIARVGMALNRSRRK